MEFPLLTEPIVYALVFLLAVSAGLAFGAATAMPNRWFGRGSGLLITFVVVFVGLQLGARAVWIGPIYALATVATTVMVAAVVRRNEPAFLAASYWRRMLLVVAGRNGQS
ncbi:hypothetical protein [Microbacterium oxydans]|uniref:hypothetical protein n=1 Tax=Microbacterium oxydans TaxID=82380 RepID=UPI0022B18D7D|nr:hypothetical protein [Microbacterium oxydans]MCZ4302516.1 hypothetical protein [Microbacterium oxydans]